MTYFIILICILIFILILFIFINKNIIEKFSNLSSLTFDKKQFNSYLLDNYKSNNVYKVNIIKNKEDIDECFKKCDFENCIKLKLMKENYDNCVKCQTDNKKCFNKLLTKGRCDPCGDNLQQMNCQNINHFACPKLKNVYNYDGDEPYYLQINNDKNITSPYKQSCLFCWNLKNYL